MIETEQRVTVRAGLAAVWAHAEDVAGWAALMPGYRECELIDRDRSRWVLKVGVGALVRTVTVVVGVDRWAGPEAVDFSYRLEGDPVEGDGSFRAREIADGETEILLGVRVRGSGAMAPMWEAMGRPVLPKLAGNFAAQLKAAIEADVPAADAEPAARLSGIKTLLGFGRTD